jgi:cell division protein FtsI/penicillin-binding protein 2
MNQQRLKLLSISIIFIFIIVVAKLFFYQVIWSYSLKNKSLSQTYKTEKILPTRGEIIDFNNFSMATNINLYKLAIYKPNLKEDLLNVFNQINTVKSNFIIDNQNTINQFSANKNQLWYVFSTPFTDQEKSQIKIDGVTFEKYQTRFYPEKEMAKPLLTGLEKYYNKQLTGKTGFMLASKDAIGNTLLTQKTWSIPHQNGFNLHTGIYKNIQFFCEKALKEGMEKYEADSGSIIIMNSQTGKIISMASLESTPSGKNIAISDLFEPGSIFKPLVMTMALDSQAIKSDYICEKCDRDRTIGNDTITNWDEKHHPDSTLKDIILNSDNIGMSFIIDELGEKRFLEYFQKLGLAQKSGIDLQGEAKPYSKTYWSHIDLATASFGQGFALNQIKFLQAFNTLALDGKMIEPKIVEYLESGQGKIQIKTRPPVSIFNQNAIKEIKDILKYAVETGPLSSLKDKDMEVCAKSGTAQVAISGKYTESSAIASYVGFSPCDKPKFTMIVTLNNPKTAIWGSQTAAPIWYEIARYLYNLL